MATAGSLSCPNCGAAAAPEARACGFCNTRLATVACPSCFGMVFVGSRHCVHCGARAREPKALDGTPWKCPRGHGELRGVALGGVEIGECLECAGLWIDEETFRRVVTERAQAAVVPRAVDETARQPASPDVVRYSPCPDCGKIMNRTNYLRISGVILDTCKGHGVWCDADEFRRVIEFVQAGGLTVAHRQAAEALEIERRRLELARSMAPHRPMDIIRPVAPRRYDGPRLTDSVGGMVVGAGLSLLFSLLKD